MNTTTDILEAEVDFSKTLVALPNPEPIIGGVEKNAGRKSSYQMDYRLLSIEPGYNARDFSSPRVLAHIETLAENIGELGILTALTIRPEDEKMFVVDGECRFRATLLTISRGRYAGQSVSPTEPIYLPVVVEPKGSDGKTMTQAERLALQNAKNQGLPFDDVEHCTNFVRLQKLGWTNARIALYSSMKVQRVERILTINEATDEVKEAVRKNEVSMSSVVRAIKSNGATKGSEVIAEAITIAKAAGKTKALPRNVAAVEARTPGQKRKAADPGVVPARDKVRILTEAMRYVVDNIDTVSARTIKTRAKTALIQIGAEEEK